MLPGILTILAGAALMLIGAYRLWTWQGAQTDTETEADWYDDSPGTDRGDTNFPVLSFMATVLGPLVGGALVIVFGIVHWLLD